MTNPETYAEWLPLLDRFRGGDNSALEEMRNGKIEWTNVVAERWTRQVAECLNARLDALSKQFQRGFDNARSDYFAVSNVLLVTRRALTPLRAFVAMPSMPSELRDHLQTELDRWISGTQKNLEDQAEKVRTDQGRLLKTMRDHSLTVPVGAAPVAPVAPVAGTDPPVVRGRRVILGGSGNNA